MKRHLKLRIYQFWMLFAIKGAVMITYVKGDMFTSPAQIITNTVNTVGVMGKGIALEFKKRYPEMYLDYQELCETGTFEIGKLVLWRKAEKWILLFPTKEHWRSPSRLEYIEKGLKKLSDQWDRLGAFTIAFPMLGCGNGGLYWEDVQPLMEKYLRPLPLRSYIYVGQYGDPLSEREQVTEIERWMEYQEDMRGYTRFKTRVMKCVQKDSVFFSERFRLKEENGILFVDGKQLEDALLCDFWELVRDAGIIEEKEIPSQFLLFSDGIFEAMHRAHYLERVFISKDGRHFPAEPNAYQYVKGEEWAYGL